MQDCTSVQDIWSIILNMPKITCFNFYFFKLFIRCPGRLDVWISIECLRQRKGYFAASNDGKKMEFPELEGNLVLNRYWNYNRTTYIRSFEIFKSYFSLFSRQNSKTTSVGTCFENWK